VTRKVLIIGCGAIFPRHLEAINNNQDYELVGVCDNQSYIVDSLSNQYTIKGYTDYKKAVKNSGANLCVIATPNSLHYEQSMFCLQNNCDILVEKPVDFSYKKITDIINLARDYKQNAYCVLQVRLNPTISLLKRTLNKGLLGDIRAVNLVQRWQRPYEYFSGWRAEPDIGGGTLYEVGIHYLDILQYLFGLPQIHATKVYKNKHKRAKIEDTIYSLLDFGEFGGTCEITVAAEPHNLECSLQILGSNGYLKIGGKAMNVIESYNFLSNGSKIKFENMAENSKICDKPNSYGSYQGSCPNHTELYKNLDKFKLKETINVIKLIEDIYNKAGIKYG
jgi:UDP-N-acetyl-2-amino-2-deoxyglucuronate dehydrogenase